MHDNGVGHPESPNRLTAIYQQLHDTDLYHQLVHFDAPGVSREQLQRVHSSEYLDSIDQHAPPSERDFYYLDPDTRLSFHTLEAARRAAGAVILATDLVLSKKVHNAFCAVRPPGHHAKKDQAMGFCIYNNITVGIAHAMAVYGLQRVALLDFDVHHGNGSENIIAQDNGVLFCSSFQHPFYPYEACDQDNPHIICSPLSAGAGGSEFRTLVEQFWRPAIDAFEPQMIFISAGFDAHRDDFLGGLNFDDEDYRWVTEQIVTMADKYAQGRIVSSLEGGYHTAALARSVELHLRALLNTN